MLGKSTAGSVLVGAKTQAGRITDYPNESNLQCKREAAMQIFGREALHVLGTASSKAVCSRKNKENTGKCEQVRGQHQIIGMRSGDWK